MSEACQRRISSISKLSAAHGAGYDWLQWSQVLDSFSWGSKGNNGCSARPVRHCGYDRGEQTACKISKPPLPPPRPARLYSVLAPSAASVQAFNTARDAVQYQVANVYAQCLSASLNRLTCT